MQFLPVQNDQVGEIVHVGDTEIVGGERGRWWCQHECIGFIGKSSEMTELL